MNVSEQILDITTQLFILSEKIETIADCVKFSLTTFWASIGVVVIVLMVALVYCINQNVKKGIEKGVAETKSLYDVKFLELENKYQKEMRNYKDELTETIIQLKNDFAVTEAGLWTPYIVGDGYEYESNEGRYYRIGSTITLWLKIKIKQKDKSSYDEAYIHGLPYAGEKIISCDITLTNSSLDSDYNNIRLFTDNASIQSNLLTYVPLCDVDGQKLKKSWLNDNSEIVGTIIYTIK